MTRVAVFGASGFVGATLVERLRTSTRWDVVPIVHSSGNAWRLARMALDLVSVDLRDEDNVRRALQGCSHVVNCSRGDDAVMLRGFKTLLRASGRLGVKRFVHISSVAVYGDPPVAGSETEDAPTKPARGSYGWIKLRQDRLLQEAAAAGLSAVALCPPNIGGPYSQYLLGILAGLRRGCIPLVESGRRPCNLVDADNLAHAIELALESGPSDGRRLFVTDGEPATWRQVVDALWPLLPPGTPVPREIAADELAGLVMAARPPGASLTRSLKHLVSSDVREVLRQDPLLAKVDRAGRRLAGMLGPAAEDRLRRLIEGRVRVPKAPTLPQVELRLTAQQLRTVAHTSGLAAKALGYRPLHTFSSSMQAFAAWYRCMTGLDSEFGDLYSKLYC